MNLALWIVLALFVLLFVLGVVLMCFASRRRKVRDPMDPEVLEHTDWNRFKDYIQTGIDWLSQHETEDLHVISYDDKVLHAKFVPCEDAKGTVLLFHGYRSHYLVDFSLILSWYHDRGFNLLLCDQRAHRESQGKYITFGIRERYDVLSWVTYLSMVLGDDHPMILHGLSMGATTVLMASDTEFPANVCGIIADCGFTSPGDIMRHLVKRLYRLPARPVVAFMSLFTRLFAGYGMEEWSTVDALKEARYPILLLHGLADDFVPSWMSRAAYDACTSEKTIVEVDGADHGRSYLVEPERCQRELQAFLGRVMP